MEVLVLGAGLVGGAMAIDLARDGKINVTVADLNPGNFTKFKDFPLIKTITSDLSDTGQVRKLSASADLVIDAMPGFLGFQTLQAIIEAGKNVIDIAFFPEDARKLDSLAKEHNVIAVPDCGVSPGMSNFWIGEATAQLDSVESIQIFVGGLPVVREWPFEYKAVFSPIDVIEEYVRPARMVINGKLVTAPALSEPELIEFHELGQLEAFNTDGLRSLIHTMSAPNMREKTLRYPGHIEKMRMLRECGFFSTEAIDVNGTKVKPLDLTAKLLFPAWQLKDGDEDLTVLSATIEGKRAGKLKRIKYELLDRFDRHHGVHSMARTTGFTATVAARMILSGLCKETGVVFPEILGRSKEVSDFMRTGLEERGISWRCSVSE